MNCPNCHNKTLNNGKYICRQDGYKIEDLNNNVIFHIEIFDYSGVYFELFY